MAQIELMNLDAALTPELAGHLLGVKIGGAMDAASVESDAEAVLPALQATPDGSIVILLLTDLVYLNSRAIGYFINWHLEMEKRGVRIYLCEMKPNVQDILETTGLTQIFPVYMTLDEAKLAAVMAFANHT